MKYYYAPTAQRLENYVPSLESYLETLTVTSLRQFARIWLGKEASKLNKEACLTQVNKVFNNPEALKEVVQQLSDFERSGLSLIKLRDCRTAYIDELAVELLMLGYSFKKSSYGYKRYDAINSLLDKGLMTKLDSSTRLVDDYSDHHFGVFADARILSQIKPLAPQTFNLTPATNVQTCFVKRPSEVLLNLVAFGQAICSVSAVTSAKGIVSKPSLKKIAKVLGWKDDEDEKSPTFLPLPTQFYFSLWQAAGFIDESGQNYSLDVNEKAEKLLEKPFEEQAKLWVRAYKSLNLWIECVPKGIYVYDDDLMRHNKFNSMRAALLVALAALPEPDAWYNISDLSRAMYYRVGLHFSMARYRSGFSPSYRDSEKEVEQAKTKWIEENLDTWQKQEQVWIQSAMTGPLYHLGLVELGFEKSKSSTQTIEFFRLTQAGRAAIYNIFRPELETKTTTTIPTTEQCWVVQPNFDVIVYLESAKPSQLAFIERIGVRKHVDGLTALYHLTQESIYQALESGIEAKIIIESLKTGSLHPIPDNIVRSLTTWAQKRERISVYCNANILEFGDKKSRDEALKKGQVKGTSIGERLILVSSINGLKPKAAISYEPNLPRCLSVDETGSIKINLASKDLLIEGELASYSQADTKNANTWIITRKTVELANSKGWTAEAIIEALSNRCSHRLPPILVKTIQAWSGKNSNSRPKALALPKVTILQVPQQDLADAIAVSKLFVEYFESRLGTNTFLVKTDMVKKLNEKLVELGFTVSNDVLLQEVGSSL